MTLAYARAGRRGPGLTSSSPLEPAFYAETMRCLRVTRGAASRGGAALAAISMAYGVAYVARAAKRQHGGKAWS